MRRILMVCAIAISMALAPSQARANGCCGAEFALAFTFGFALPVILTAVDAACDAPRHCPPPPVVYAPPPPRPADPPAPADPPPPPARRAAPRDFSGVGEITVAARRDPARDEAERLLASGEAYRAAEAYRALSIERPSDATIALRFAESLLASGNRRLAEHQLRRVIRGGATLRAVGPASRLAGFARSIESKLAAGDPSGRLLAAFAALGAGDPDRARLQVDQVLRARPDDREARILRDEILRRIGDPGGRA